MTRSIAPNSAIASFFRNLPDTLQQPATIGMMGSVGAHLLFFATLPAFTPDESVDPDREIRRVQVIDLPRNESQTTQALRSPLGLPPVPNLQNPTVQPNQPTPGQSSSVLIPPNPLYTLPDFNIPAPPPGSSVIPELARRQPRSILIPKTEPTRPRTQPTTRPAQQPQPQPTTPDNTSPGGLTPYNPDELARTEPPTEFNQPTQPQPGVSPAPQPEASPAPSPTTAAQNPLIAQRLAEIQELQRKIVYNATGTETGEITKSFGDWYSKVLSDRNLANATIVRQPAVGEPIPELPYPISVKLNDYKQHPAVVVVLVDPDGKPVTEPELLGSTGYGLLNDAAKEYVKQQKFEPLTAEQRKEAEAENRLYRVFRFEFKYQAPTNTPTAAVPQAQN